MKVMIKFQVLGLRRRDGTVPFQVAMVVDGEMSAPRIPRLTAAERHALATTILKAASAQTFGSGWDGRDG